MTEEQNRAAYALLDALNVASRHGALDQVSDNVLATFSEQLEEAVFHLESLPTDDETKQKVLGGLRESLQAAHDVGVFDGFANAILDSRVIHAFWMEVSVIEA